MSLKDVSPGRYSARVSDWGIEEVEKLDGAVKVNVLFDIYIDENSWEQIKWDGFIQKKDGSINKKTVDSLFACGLKGDFLDLLPGGPGLDKSKELEITVIKDGEYLRVEWINEPGGSSFIKKADGQAISKKLKGLSLIAGLKKQVRNHAPGAEPAFDANEEIPF